MILLFVAYLSLLSLLFSRCYSAVLACCYSARNAAFSRAWLIAAVRPLREAAPRRLPRPGLVPGIQILIAAEHQRRGWLGRNPATGIRRRVTDTGRSAPGG